MRGTSIICVDVNAVVEKLCTALKGALEKVVDNITTHMSNSNEEVDVKGLRAQIIANVNVLVPLMKCPGMYKPGKGYILFPKSEIHVITLGEEPHIRAFVFHGNAASCDKFISAETATTVAGALNNLLKETQHLLEKHEEEIGTVGPPEISNLVNLAGWDSDEITNHAFHAASGWGRGPIRGVYSDNSNDSAIGGCGHMRIIPQGVVAGNSPAYTDNSSLLDLDDISSPSSPLITEVNFGAQWSGR